MIFSDLILNFLEKDVGHKLQINVIGDAMIDEYYQVDVSRISPEFPIPVYQSRSEEPTSGYIPGGAANVARQFEHFNIDVDLVSLVSPLSKNIFNGFGIRTDYSKTVDSLVVPVKKRIYCDDTPLVRWDFEQDNYGLEDIKKHLFDLDIPTSDFNIFSDYSKGVFCVPWFRKFIKKAPSIVDPKRNFIDFWEDCTIFKPNANEAKTLSEKKHWQDQADFFMDSLRCDGVVITQSSDGVVGKQDDYFEIRPEAHKIKPESVIGAGDCFVSFLAMALARGFNLNEASRIAFAAGSYYVQRKHNKPISPAEMLIIANKKVIRNPSILKNRNFKLVFTNGCFDILHAGHLSTFEFAKTKGDKLVVALNSDKSVKKLKGSSRPIIDEANRIKMIEALNMVDFVVCFDEETPFDVIKEICPDVLVKGGDYQGIDIVGKDIAKETFIAPFVPGLSTSKIIQKVQNV
jgi:D-beta-D-heptose 7-phosphate kinase/D-beta-D-heptose 1-phosphate adenosyltransferase